MSSQDKRVVVVLPTYNEADNISLVVGQLFTVFEKVPKYNCQILVVDDNSPDGTASVVQKIQKKHKSLHLITGKKKGLGAAYIRGMKHSINKLNADILFEMDSDLSHDPKLIPAFIKEIENGSDFVVGSRYMKGGSIPSDWGIDRKMFSIAGNLVVRFGLMIPKVNEWSNGYRAIRSPVFRRCHEGLENYSGYIFQIAFLHRAIREGFTVSEIPIHFIDRTKGDSKFSAIEFIPDVLRYILTESSFVKYFITGSFGFLLDFTIAATLISFGMFKPTANAISASIAIMANYLVNNYWSFSHKKIQGGAGEMTKQFAYFLLVALGSVAIQYTGMYLALTIFGDGAITILSVSIPLWVIYKTIIIMLFVIPYSFIMYNKFIWKDNKRD